MAETSWSILSRHFNGSLPKRYISGIAISGRQPNANGRYFRAAGLEKSRAIVPLLLDHNWCQPIGR
jgi:hypothetical protein